MGNYIVSRPFRWVLLQFALAATSSADYVALRAKDGFRLMKARGSTPDHYGGPGRGGDMRSCTSDMKL